VAVGYSGEYSFGNGDWTGVSGKGWADAIIVKYDHDGNVIWKKNFGGSDYDNYTWVAATSDGVVAVGIAGFGSFGTGDWTGVEGKGSNYFDAIIVKYDFDGNVVWKKNFGGSEWDQYTSVTAVSDGVVAVGTSWEGSFGTGDWEGVAGKGNSDAIIVKYDNDGNVIWKKNFGGDSIDGFRAITEVADGYVAVGLSFSFNTGDWTGIMGKGYNDATMVKYDFDGNVEWKKNFGGIGYDDFIWVCEIYGGFIAMGNSGPEFMLGDNSFGTGDWTGVIGKGGQDATVVKCGTLVITFIPVTEIINVPLTAAVGDPLNLKGTVVPGNATYQTFTWSMLDAGTTGATISGGFLNATGTGIALVRATIANGLGEGDDYEQDFSITVNPEGFISVKYIDNITTSTTAGVPLMITARVVPGNATHQTIVWSIMSAGSTGATITGGNILNTTAAGTVIVEARIVNGIGTDIDYVKECVIAVNPEGFVSVTDITNVPNVTMVGVPLPLTGTVVPGNAAYKTITWSVLNAGITGATISNGNILNSTKAGTATIRATIENGTGIGIAYIQDFKIGINPEDFVAVADIIDVPTETMVKEPLLLTGTVVPDNASCQTIKWSIGNAGGTGATISGGNTLNITKAGTVIVRATIAGGAGIGIEYTQDFSITVEAIPEEISEILQPNPLKAYTQNRILYVSGLTVGDTWRVYDILGKLVYQGVAADETASTALPVSGVYIIRSGGKTGKVVVR